MIKKIAVHEMRPGMFVHDFNCGVSCVYIDTYFGSDARNAATAEYCLSIRDGGVRVMI